MPFISSKTDTIGQPPCKGVNARITPNTMTRFVLRIPISAHNLGGGDHSFIDSPIGGGLKPAPYNAPGHDWFCRGGFETRPYRRGYWGTWILRALPCSALVAS